MSLAPFLPDEHQSRLARVRARMAENGADALVVFDPANIAWVTGYDGWSFYVPQCAVVLPDGEPLWWGRGIDAAGARRTAWMRDENILAYSDDLIHNPPRHPADDLAAALRAKGLARATIGVGMDSHYFTAACFAALRQGLPHAKFVDAESAVNWSRAVKSPRELAMMENAARIVEKIHARIREFAEPGVAKNKLAAEILRAGISESGGDYPAIMPMLPAGADAAAAHLTWDDSLLKKGEGVFFEVAGCFRRYHCPLARTIYFGTPPQKWRDAESALREGIAAALEAMRPGARCGEVASALRRALRGRGFEKAGRCGYSVGLGYPPDWGERTFSLREEDETVLEVGMCAHIMPGLWRDDWGMEITETVVVEPGGARPLANVARELTVKK